MALNPFRRQLERLIPRVAAGLYGVGQSIMADSQELVAVDTGTLKSSGRVLLPELVGDELRVVVGYGYGETINPHTGQPAIGYAAVVHETHPTKAKYLERPALEHAEHMGGEVAVSIRRTVRTELGTTKGLGRYTEELTTMDGGE